MEKILKDKLNGGKFSNVSPIHSKRMSAVKGRGNKTTEVSLRLALARARIKGWKVHPKGLVGNPDFFFPKNKLAVFVDGCFWHGCAKCGHIPKVNNSYWAAKIRRNQERDIEKTKKLNESGIKVLRLWEHEIQADIESCVLKIKDVIGIKRSAMRV